MSFPPETQQQQLEPYASDHRSVLIYMSRRSFGVLLVTPSPDCFRVVDDYQSILEIIFQPRQPPN